MTIKELLSLQDSPRKTAALALWIQELYESEPPVLVGGAVVELLTGGAYTTGDLDFVGRVPRAVARKLQAADFEKRGRHWIHEQGQIFVAFPSEELDPEEPSVLLEVGGSRVLVLAPEAVVVDRLAAWEFWKSSTDAANAFFVYRAVGNRLDRASLRRLARKRKVASALARLESFAERFVETDPTETELAQWAERDRS